MYVAFTAEEVLCSSVARARNRVGRFPVPFSFYPTQGDCVTNPVTEFGMVVCSTLST